MLEKNREESLTSRLHIQGTEDGRVEPVIEIGCGDHYVLVDAGTALEFGQNLIRIVQQGMDEADLLAWYTEDSGAAEAAKTMLRFFAFRRERHSETA